MSVIDEDGALFGVVNIIDALVVLLLCAATVGGIAVVVGGGSGNASNSTASTATTHVTLDLGNQPDYILSAINEGDTYSPNSRSTLTVTDVHFSPGGNQTAVVVRAELQGPADGNSVEYINAEPRLGRTLRISTSQYNLSGNIRAVGDSPTLDGDETTVVVRETVSALDADEITAGDEIMVGGRTAATVENVTVYPTSDASRHEVFVEASLNTYSRQDDQYFGETQVRRGQTVTLPAAEYTIDGRIEQVGSGLESNTTEVLLTDTIDTETAESISEGDVATVAGYTTAEVETVTTYATQNPDQTRVFVGLSLTTLGYGEQAQFGSTTVHEGNQIHVTTDTYDLSAPIERVGALEQRGTPTNQTVTLSMSDVDEDSVDDIEVGMTEQSDNRTIARVTDVSVEPEVIIVTADDGSVNVADHPYLREVTLTAELRVRETTSGVRFKGERIQQGSTVVIDFGTQSIEAEVESIGV